MGSDLQHIDFSGAACAPVFEGAHQPAAPVWPVGLVLLRLLVPVNFGSGAWSVLNVLSELTPPQETAAPILAEEADEINPQLSIVDPDPTFAQSCSWWSRTIPCNPICPLAVEPVADPASGQEDEVAPETVLTVVWAVGAASLGAWLVGVNVRFARTLRRAAGPWRWRTCPCRCM